MNRTEGCIPQLIKAYLQHMSRPLMAGYLLHLVGRKLTSGFSPDSAGSMPLMKKKKTFIYTHKEGTGLQIEQDPFKS